MRKLTAKQKKFFSAIDERASVVSRDQRRRMQSEIYRHVLLNSPSIRTGNFESVSSADLGQLFHVTDELFFDGGISRFMESSFDRPLKFRLSTRMTTSGGTTTMFTMGKSRRYTEFEIAIATTPLFGTYKIDSHAKVGGLVCRSRLEALQRIMEHEIVHLVELLGTDDSNCQGRQFKLWVKQIFGHVESNHQLMTPSDIARRQLGIRCGDEVIFSADGANRRGIVNRITKRATVLVKDPTGTRYTDGECYSKYYVPLPMLRRA